MLPMLSQLGASSSTAWHLDRPPTSTLSQSLTPDPIPQHLAKPCPPTSLSHSIMADAHFPQNDSDLPYDTGPSLGPHPPPERRKAKRKQVKNACTNCQKAAKKCEDARPCQRCMKTSKADTCRSSIHEPCRRSGPRGPYKKRSQLPALYPPTSMLDQSLTFAPPTQSSPSNPLLQYPICPLPMTWPRLFEIHPGIFIDPTVVSVRPFIPTPNTTTRGFEVESESFIDPRLISSGSLIPTSSAASSMVNTGTSKPTG